MSAVVFCVGVLPRRERARPRPMAMRLGAYGLVVVLSDLVAWPWALRACADVLQDGTGSQCHCLSNVTSIFFSPARLHAMMASRLPYMYTSPKAYTSLVSGLRSTVGVVSQCS